MAHSKKDSGNARPKSLDAVNLRIAEPHVGKIPPQSIEMEMAILGALLLDHHALAKIKSFVTPEVFYPDSHQIIYKAILQLDKENVDIDLLTVTDQVQKTNDLESVGGAFYLVELTGRVASAANIESHCKILYQLFMRRKAIERAYKTVQDAFDLKKDIFEINEEIINDSRFVNPRAMIKYQTMNDTMELGAQANPSQYIMGNLIKENEVGIIFGDEGCGKSLLCMHAAAQVADGNNVFIYNDPALKNNCKPKKVLFYDFELEDAEIFTRYSDQDAILKLKNKADKSKFMKQFNPNFIRAFIDPDFLDFDEADKHILNEIEVGINKHQPELVFVDNLTFISSESTDPAMATKLMKKLLQIQRRNPGLTIIVIAHTPKRDSSMPMESKHIAGAKNIPNFAKSIIAVGKSQLDPNFRYLKHVKCRNGQLLHGYDNVVECRITKDRVDLKFEVTGFGPEKPHLYYQDLEERKAEIDNIITKLKDHDHLSYQRIVNHLLAEEGVRMDKSTAKRRYDKARAKSFKEVEDMKQKPMAS